MFAKTRTVPVLTALALGALTTSIASAAGLVCPCGPVGMVKLKHMEKVGTGKLKVYCTNNAARTGDFKAYFCTADGKKKHVGSCIFIGGQNDWQIIKGPNGQPCFIVWTNVDGGADDGRPWDAVVWVHDIKNCKTTSYCLNKTPGGGWEVTGDYACIDEHWYAAHADDPDDVYDREFMLASFGEVYTTDGPASFMDGYTLTIDSTNRRGGLRELTFNTGIGLYAGRAGDRLVLNGVPASAITNLNPAFRVLGGFAELPVDAVVPVDEPAIPVSAVRARIPGQPGDDTVPIAIPVDQRRPAPVSVILEATADYAINNGDSIATISGTSTTGFTYTLTAAGEAEFAEVLTATACSLLTDTSFMDARLASAAGDIAAASFVVDVNFDGAVDLADVGAIITMWGTNDEPCDVNEDGVVGLSDLTYVIQRWAPAMP